jgi:hypothetical protein
VRVPRYLIGCLAAKKDSRRTCEHARHTHPGAFLWGVEKGSYLRLMALSSSSLTESFAVFTGPMT